MIKGKWEKGLRQGIAKIITSDNILVEGNFKENNLNGPVK